MGRASINGQIRRGCRTREEGGGSERPLSIPLSGTSQLAFRAGFSTDIPNWLTCSCCLRDVIGDVGCAGGYDKARCRDLAWAKTKVIIGNLLDCSSFAQQFNSDGRVPP